MIDLNIMYILTVKTCFVPLDSQVVVKVVKYPSIYDDDMIIDYQSRMFVEINTKKNRVVYSQAVTG